MRGWENFGEVQVISDPSGGKAAKGGKRKDLDDVYFRSAWEANWARYLSFLVEQGNIKSWEYEPEEFWFEGIKRGRARSYKPDFKIFHNDGTICYHEVKGWMDQVSRTKLKRMGKYHPDVEVLVIGAGEYNEVKRKLSRVIPNWE